MYWFNDRIEIFSVGGAYCDITADNFGEPGLTDYRNPNMAEAIHVFGFVQHFGMGIPIARKLLAKNGNPELKFKIYGTAVVATIYSRNNK